VGTEKDQDPEGGSADSPPSERVRPKRGAFPTPTSELEKAEQYNPDADEETDDSQEKPDRPDADREHEG
jgi:hypothetical protein